MNSLLMVSSVLALDIVKTVENAINHEIFWRIVLAIVEFGAAFLIGSLASKAIMKISVKVANKGIMTFLASFSNVAIKVAGTVIALSQLGVNMNLIIGALSALGLGVSLALKDNMASVASGLQILLTNPFKVGDYIRVDGKEGLVRSIELTYTVIQTIDDNTIILPNEKAIFKTIVNYSDKTERRLIMEFPCKKEDIEKTKAILLQAAGESALVLAKPAPDVWIGDWYYNGVTLKLVVYTKWTDYWNASTDINNKILPLLSRYQITVQNPVPVMDPPVKEKRPEAPVKNQEVKPQSIPIPNPANALLHFVRKVHTGHLALNPDAGKESEPEKSSGS